MSNSTAPTNLDYTYSFSKYSCMRSFYFIHVTCCYLVFLSGIACFVSRLHPKLKWFHASFGRIYIISMLFATASALLINNTGLPGPTLISFSYSMGGLSVSWMLIKIYQYRTNNIISQMVQQSIIKMQSIDKQFNLSQLFHTKTVEWINSRTWKQRFFSLKTAHGILMLLSWFGIAGRIFASNQSGDFTCYTYPVYKPVNTDTYPDSLIGMELEDQPLMLVPEIDPNYDRLPWAGRETVWAVQGFFTPIIIGTVVALIWICVTSKRNDKYNIAKTKHNSYESTDTIDTPSGSVNESNIDMELEQTNITGNQKYSD